VAVAPDGPRAAIAPREGGRQAGWAELFFDLVFVVAVANLAHHLEGDPGPVEFGEFLLLLVAPWWSWLNFTAFANVSGGGGSRVRLLLLLAMAAMGVMVVATPDALGARADVYAIGFIASRLVSLAMWLPLAKHREDTLSVSSVFAFHGISTVFWVASIFVPMPYQAVLWLIGVAGEVAVVVLMQRAGDDSEYQISHVAERVGLFIIIVFGESVAASLRALDHHWSGGGAVILALGFVLFAALWWAYFDFAITAVERELAPGDNARVRDIMGIGHFPIVAALTAMAAGLGTAVAEPHHLPLGAAAAMCGGLVVYRITVLLLAWRLRGRPGLLTWVIPALVVASGAFALTYFHLIPAWALVALLAAESAGHLLRGIKVRRRRRGAGAAAGASIGSGAGV
jgi:low temperature requirement protein LtrA